MIETIPPINIRQDNGFDFDGRLSFHHVFQSAPGLDTTRAQFRPPSRRERHRYLRHGYMESVGEGRTKVPTTTNGEPISTRAHIRRMD